MAIAEPTTYAASPTLLALDSSNRPLAANALVVSRFLDSQTTTISVGVRLQATGGDIDNLQFLASDLIGTCTPRIPCDTPQITIDSSDISIPQGVSFKDGDIKDVLVTINTITHPAEYNGDLTFLIPGQPLATALTVKLSLLVDARPDVMPINPGITAKTVHGQLLFDCFLASWLVPNSSCTTGGIIQLENRTSVPVKITSVQIELVGQVSQTRMTTQQILAQLPKDGILPPDSVTTIPLDIQTDALPPDSYQGPVRFQFQNSFAPVSVSAIITVRNGPFLALLAIFVGVLIGRLALSMTTPRALKQLHLLPLYTLLSNQIQGLETSTYALTQEVIEDLKARLQIVYGEIESSEARYSEDAVANHLYEVEDRKKFFGKLKGLEKEIQESSVDEKTKKDLFEDVKRARNAMLNGNDDEAKQREQSIRGALHPQKLAATQETKQREPTSREDLSLLAQASQGRRQKILTTVLTRLAGYQRPSAKIRYWLCRPFLGFVLLVVLVLLGMWTLYVSMGTFGANSYYDYLGLLLWGFSADTAQRSLQNLPMLSISSIKS